MENLLREILSQDKTILSRRDELIAELDKKVTGDLSRSYAPIKRAINLNVGEIFFVGESDKEATKEKVREILKSSGMQEARIVIETFTKALDWDKIPFLNFSDEIEEVEETPPQPKISLTKNVAPKSNSTINEIFKNPNVETTKEEAAPSQNHDDVIENVSRELDELQAQSQPEDNFQSPPKVEENFSQENFNSLPQNHKTTIFTTEGRLNRWAYFKQSLKLMGLAIIGFATAMIYIGWIILLAVCVGGYMLAIRRLHDLNKSGWWVLVFLIPYVNFIFSLYVWFAPGTKGVNRYGFDPLME